MQRPRRKTTMWEVVFLVELLLSPFQPIVVIALADWLRAIIHR